MTNFNECKLRIGFKLGKCNNKLFNLSVNGEQLIPIQTEDSIIAVYEKNIVLPTQIKICTYGKDNNTDTLIDDNGNIVDDLFVQIDDIHLDNFELNEKFLHQKINVVTENGEVYTTSYIGFNGTTLLDFQEENVFSQVMMCNE